MKELGKSFSLSGQGTLAVLAAINIADEYFDAVAEADALRAEKEKLREETEQYLRMWEEAKKNFAHYKEAAARRMTPGKPVRKNTENLRQSAPNLKVHTLIFRWKHENQKRT